MISNKAILAIATVISLAVASPAGAQVTGNVRGAQPLGLQLAVNDGHGHGKDDHADHKSGHDHGHDDKSHFDVKSFSSVKEAWSFLATATAEAETLATEKKFDRIHEIAEQIGSAVHTLEDKSDMVLGDNREKLGVALKQLDKAADELHHSAESNDADAVALSIRKAKGLLPLVQDFYPNGSL